MSKPLRVLIVEDSEDDALLIARLLEKGGYDLDWKRVETSEAMLQALEEQPWDAIISDYAMPRFSGLAALKCLHKSGLDLPFIMVSGRMGEETAVEAMRAGAHDYLMKERLHRLLPALEREIREASIRSHRREAVWRLRTQERFLRQIIDASPTRIYTRDRIGRFTMANKATADFYGVPLDDLIGRHLSELQPDEDTVERSLAEDREVLATGVPKTVREVLLQVPGSDRHRWHQVLKLPIVPPGEHDLQVLGLSIDITERKQAEARLQHDALHDTLTGLPNRALFMEQVEFALAHHRRARDYEFAVLYVEISRLRVPDAAMDAASGEKLLAELADRLRKSVRTNDTISRLGGDEFAVLLDGIDSAAAAVRAADRLHEHVGRPISIAGREVYPSAAIGIALGSTGYDQAEHLLRDAGTAMYRAKTSSKAHELFDHRLHEQVAARLKLEADLRRSISRGDFVLHYQPIIALRDGRLVGFEALLRWQRTPEELVTPGDFMPAAEQTGLIVPLGLWTLQTACNQIRQWNREHAPTSPLWVSVNLSPLQFAQGDLIEEVDRILGDTGADARWLKLEITEATAMQRTEHATGSLARLRDRGVHIVIDDFGTGCSSLSRLQSLPFDTLKIDRSFVGAMRSDDRGLGFVRTIVMLAHGLGMTVSAEGVETQQQRTVLTDLGCEFAQGFLFSHAVPAPEAAHLIAADMAV